ncbi:hypothetical protein [Blastopirellula marina]|uniref:Lipoprotein n=1 Tax=Blastopirellula marina DSM 3645 TaxID=314230 RepID=A3ZXA4_9BACT|nr:hypothetical protein [Blastopirellula marina]EAQ78852.1 hypothetical protein DSM3645_30161 [Blastopirellula marina DSM 3645]
MRAINRLIHLGAARRNWIALLLLGGVLGCSGGDNLDRREVRGAVTYSGKPVQEGTITLFPIDAGMVASGKIENGRYEIPRYQGPIPGEYRVELTGLQATGRMIRLEEPGMAPQEIPEVKSILPAKYNDRSELTLTIDREQQVTVSDFLLEE